MCPQGSRTEQGHAADNSFASVLSSVFTEQHPQKDGGGKSSWLQIVGCGGSRAGQYPPVCLPDGFCTLLAGHGAKMAFEVMAREV